MLWTRFLWRLSKLNTEKKHKHAHIFVRPTSVKRVIDSLKIYCLNRSKGCDEITTLSECNQHLEKCLFVVVSCTKKCGEIMLRKKLQDHEDNKCPNCWVLRHYCSIELDQITINHKTILLIEH